ncbi:MAG: trypsin-like peptidase domain-containing protein [Candidatus Melainabacteria bacterium]|nr:trypsin-like peptidase domain-containing protein [Candidatus Melainabacteria bacterium]
MGADAPLDIRSETQRRSSDHVGSHIDVLELQKSARIPKGPRHPAAEPKDFNYGSIEELIGSTVTDRKNKLCPTVAKPGEVPILRPGSVSKGCEYTDASKDPLAASIYKQHKAQTVILNVSGESGQRKGSGVMVDKDKDTCTILTDAHVTNGLKIDKTIYGMTVTTAAGEKFPATLRKVDPTTDLSLVTMQTGKETDRICKPVKVAKDDSSAAAGNPLVTLGAPEYSTSVYASPSVSKGKNQLIYEFASSTKIPGHPWLSEFSEVVAGEDTGRMVIESNGQIYAGNSGGPTFNRDGELVGVANRVKQGKFSLSTPVTTATIDELKR